MSVDEVDQLGELAPGLTRPSLSPDQMRSRPREIPYDYVAKITLSGVRGRRQEEVINVSVEGAFVAKAIGYSFIPAELPNRASKLAALRVTTGGISPAGLGDARAPIVNVLVDPHLMVARVAGIDFKYSIIDSSTGRELQNLPIHNVAGLGEPNGLRPFRPMAKPILFMPRSTIRVVIDEISSGDLYTGAELFFVLHGYKILGFGG
jgi:hypothetical protein